MKTAVKPKTYFNPFLVRTFISSSKTNIISSINSTDTRYYQKIFIVFIALFTFLIFPESPKELENICTNYHSKKMCVKW